MGYSETFCGAHKHLTEMEIIMSKKQTNQSPNYENCSDSTQNCGSNNSSNNLLQSQATRALTNLLTALPTNLPTRLPIVLLIRQTIVCTRVGICSTQHQLCSDRILADHVFIIGSEKFSITKSSSQVSCKQHEAYLLFLFCLSVCSEFTDWIA